MNQRISKSKPTISAIVVVEGKTDTDKLKSIFNVRTIETNGSRLSYKTINLIKRAAKTSDIILFLDPDAPGEKIRKRLQNELDSFQQAFIKKNPKAKKIGVAEAIDEEIITAFKNLKTFKNNNQSISIEEYQSLNLNSKAKRKVITDYYKISECNNKQLFKRLNMMDVNLSTIKKILNKN